MPILTDYDIGNFEIKEIDGKTAFVFETPPALLFISKDGVGQRDHLYVHGEEVKHNRSIAINSTVEELTTYSCEKFACVKDE